MTRRLRLAVLGLSGSVGVVVLALVVLCLATGCSTLAYYSQSVQGHLALLDAARPVDDWLADPGTPPALKRRLALSQRMREFAVRELKLPDNASYRRYAQLDRPAAVWNVVAAPELGLTLKTWCFPVVGCVGYRGYFHRDDADREAAALLAQGWEVAVYGVPAYSTLGSLPGDFFADPLLSTFIGYPQGELARLIFHELAHQVAYAKGDTTFNESFATAVERIGVQRWLAQRADAQARAEYERFDARRRDFRALTGRYREALQRLYASDRPDTDKRTEKARLFAQLRSDFDAMKRERWDGYAGYDRWFEQANNASLGVLAAYHALVPAFDRLFERDGGDFERFYAEVRRLAALPRDERREALDRDAAPR